ncbi:MAG: hypothetical protein ACJA2Q_002269 [Pseudohongiellaceae bacterium]|jgi:hypothetical protein
MNKIPVLLCLLTLAPSILPSSLAAEEKIFIDDLTTVQLRIQIEKIQKEIYRIFNKSNDGDLKIICHDYLATGTSIKKEVCEPQFVISERSENTRTARVGGALLLTSKQLQDTLSTNFQELTEAMEALSMKSEYFAELNSILGLLNTRLEELVR